MTILGRHTVAEVRAIGRAIDYKFKQVDAAFKSISADWIAANPGRYEKLKADWGKAKSEWGHSWSGAQLSIDILAKASGVSEDLIPAESDWNNIMKHTAQMGRNGDDSLYMTTRYVEQITKKSIDFSGQPSQDVYDADMKAYKKVDATIKQGEKAADNKLLYIGIGAGAAVAALVAVKVYL